MSERNKGFLDLPDEILINSYNILFQDKGSETTDNGKKLGFIILVIGSKKIVSNVEFKSWVKFINYLQNEYKKQEGNFNTNTLPVEPYRIEKDYTKAKEVFFIEEGRVADLNNTHDMKIVSILEVGLRYGKRVNYN